MKDIDLRELAEQRGWKVTIEPGIGVRSTNEDFLYYLNIPCRSGVISLYGGDELCVVCDGHPKIATKLHGLPGITPSQGYCVFRFPISRLDEVAAMVKPLRRKGPARSKSRAKYRVKRTLGGLFSPQTDQPRGNQGSEQTAVRKR